MTPDDFTAAARAESIRLIPEPEDGERFHLWSTTTLRDHAESIAEWARTRLAGREASNLAAAHRAIAEVARADGDSGRAHLHDWAAGQAEIYAKEHTP